MSRHYKIAVASAFIIGLCFGAPQLVTAQFVTPQYTVTQVSGLALPAGTLAACGVLFSQTADPFGPFYGQSVELNGSGLPSGFCGPVRCELLHLLYRFRIDFKQPVKINSVDIVGLGDYTSGGNAAVLRLLDANSQPLATLSTSYLGAGFCVPQAYSLNANGVTGTTFFIDEFDYSTTSAYRSHIGINFTNVSALAITPSSLAIGIVGSAYSQSMAVSGGTAPYTWSAVGLAPGLSIDPASGLISGMPTQAGTFTVTINVADSTGLTGPAQYSLTINACQVPSFASFHQYDGPPLVPSAFGFVPTPNPLGYMQCSTKKAGCALTATATMLTSFPSGSAEFPGFLDLQLSSLVPPGYGTGVIWGTTTRDWCEFTPTWSIIPELYPILLVDSGSGILSASCQQSLNAVDCYLKEHVCQNNDRVVLKLNEFEDGAYSGSHYVFVTGELSQDWSVFDPGWNPANTSPGANLSTLSGHTSGFTTSNGVQHSFQVSEARTYHDLSSAFNQQALSVTVNSPVEFLVIDPSGLRLGHLETIAADVFEIPKGSYLHDSLLADDTGVGSANGDPSGIKTAYIPFPEDGAYKLQLTGAAPGTYSLRVRALHSDGTSQDLEDSGVTNTGSVTGYQIAYSPTVGSTFNVVRVATFTSTLADITNSLQLGLIDNAGIANALRNKIQEAAQAAAEHESDDAREVLNAFKNQVRAQTGKHITGVMPQVLLQDANSLISQLPKSSGK